MTSPAAGDGRVTAVVVTHNSADHLKGLGSALLNASRVPERLLVIDNASADDSVSRARKAGFEVHEAGSNDGFGAACNVALSICDSEYMLICNPDLMPSHSALEHLVKALSESPTAAVAGGGFDAPLRARQYSRISSDLWGFLPHWLQRPLSRFDEEEAIDPAVDTAVVDYVIGAFMLCRVAALRAIGGFDESYFLYSEEEDLCRRLSASRWHTLIVPAASLKHEVSTSSKGVTAATMQPFRFHSLYRYYRKFHSRRYAELSRVVIAAFVTSDRLYRALTRQPQEYAPGSALAPYRSIAALRSAHDRRLRAETRSTSH